MYSIALITALAVGQAPGPLALAVGGGEQMFELASRDRKAGWLLQTSAAYQLSDWFSARALLDYANSSDGTSDLTFTNHNLMLGVGGGMRHWLGKAHVDATLAAGPLLSILTLDEEGRSPRHGTRWSAAVDMGGSAGMSLGPLSLLALRAGLRYEPHRLHVLVLLEVEWSPPLATVVSSE